MLSDFPVALDPVDSPVRGRTQTPGPNAYSVISQHARELSAELRMYVGLWTAEWAGAQSSSLDEAGPPAEITAAPLWIPPHSGLLQPDHNVLGLLEFVIRRAGSIG